MSSSSNDELPGIPGTKYPCMEDDATSSSSRSPRKIPKRPRISAVEKEKKKYKGSRMKKKSTMMDISSDDDDFLDPRPGTSKNTNPMRPQPNAEELKRQKKKEYNDRFRAKQSVEQQNQEKLQQLYSTLSVC